MSNIKAQKKETNSRYKSGQISNNIMTRHQKIINRIDGFISNPVVAVAVPIACVLVDFFTMQASVDSTWSFAPVLLYAVCATMALIIDGIPTIVMPSNGDFFSKDNKKWRIGLYIMFAMIFVLRVITGKQIVSVMTLQDLGDNEFLKILYYVFSALLLTAINVLSSLLCFYISYRKDFIVENYEYRLKIEDELAHYQRQKLELNDLKNRIQKYYYEYDQKNKECALQALDYSAHYWDLMSKVVLMRKLDGTPDQITSLYNEAEVYKKKVYEIQNFMNQYANSLK